MRAWNEQLIIPVEAADLLNKVRDMKKDGQRLLQICATKVSEGFQTDQTPHRGKRSL